MANTSANVGGGKMSESDDSHKLVKIPDDLLIKEFDNPIKAIVQSTYPNLHEQYQSQEYMKCRTILTSTVESVDKINDYILSSTPGEAKEYLSADSAEKLGGPEGDALAALTPPEFLNTLSLPDFPKHKLKLKVGTPVMLLMDMDPFQGLCIGARLIITRLGNFVLGAKMLSGGNAGEEIPIPRITMSPSPSPPWPFKLKRRQYPIAVCYATTIDKSQGQSFANVGLYLPRPVSRHGELYMALSRVESKQGLKILILDEEGKASDTTTNIVYQEIFRNLK
ncbi:unnamed protein product [Cuscuta epithymum]|uniref:DNA helicase Pif1-like 2B domain-containing protein n=1 Tax=Cuscuta epithymum TaxID=186058 RepID=A0AAV0EMK4_9ASTE|nr:unnamed protein product [Cuscuta epithymum]